MPFVPFKNRAEHRADAAEMRDNRVARPVQKRMARPARQNAITDGMIKLSNFYFLTLGLRVL